MGIYSSGGNVPTIGDSNFSTTLEPEESEPCAHCSSTSSAVKRSSSAAPSSCNNSRRSRYSLGASSSRVAPVMNDNHRVAYSYSTKQLLHLDSRSPEWNIISKSEKEKLGLTVEDDGEFW